MILLPDEDEKPVGVQINGLIGEALRHSVAGAEPSPDFARKLAAALAAAGGGEQAEAATAEANGGAAGLGKEAAAAAS